MTPKQKSPPDCSEGAFHDKTNKQSAFYHNNQYTGSNPDQNPALIPACNLAVFQNAIRAAGLSPPRAIIPGNWHRLPGLGKPKSNRAGWCRLFPDGRGGCFGDWSTGLSEIWQARRDAPLSHAEREEFKRRVTEAREKAEADRRKAQDNAAKRAGGIWNTTRPASNDHPYTTIRRFLVFLVRFSCSHFHKVLVRYR